MPGTIIEKKQVQPYIYSHFHKAYRRIFYRPVLQPDSCKRNGGKGIDPHNDGQPFDVFRMLCIAYGPAQWERPEVHRQDKNQGSGKKGCQHRAINPIFFVRMACISEIARLHAIGKNDQEKHHIGIKFGDHSIGRLFKYPGVKGG